MNVKQLFKRLFLTSIVLFVFLAAGAENNELTISHNLPGTLWNLHDKEVVVTFSHDMVPLGGQREGRSILDISPKVEGEFLW